MTKQFFICCRWTYRLENGHSFEQDLTIGRASSMRSAKSVIRSCRKVYQERNPRDFRVYDSWADVDELTNFVPCVYAED